MKVFISKTERRQGKWSVEREREREYKYKSVMDTVRNDVVRNDLQLRNAALYGGACRGGAEEERSKERRYTRYRSVYSHSTHPLTDHGAFRRNVASTPIPLERDLSRTHQSFRYISWLSRLIFQSRFSLPLSYFVIIKRCGVFCLRVFFFRSLYRDAEIEKWMCSRWNG